MIEEARGKDAPKHKMLQHDKTDQGKTGKRPSHKEMILAHKFRNETFRRGIFFLQGRHKIQKGQKEAEKGFIDDKEGTDPLGRIQEHGISTLPMNGSQSELMSRHEEQIRPQEIQKHNLEVAHPLLLNNTPQ